MICDPKEELYRNLKYIKDNVAQGDVFSHEYMACVDAIKEPQNTPRNV